MGADRGNPRGRAGEEHAAARLAEQGYTILARNHHSRYGEVDIIAAKEDVICFVEVKTRRGGAVVTGAEAVGPAKQRKIIRTALLYLQAHPEHDLQPRFDLITVTTNGTGGEVLCCDHLEGAFDGEAYTRTADH